MGPTGSAAILFCCICVVASMAVVASAAPKKQTPKYISMGVLERSNITKKAAPTARKLIGGAHGHGAGEGAAAAGVCPVQFDHVRGISAVTGSCRDRPVISPERCCGAFRTFACPYSDILNEKENGCANDMFFQIIVRGRLRPGLFSQMCVEGPLGLNC